MVEGDPHSRDSLRRAYADAWRKRLAGSPLSPLEAMLTDVIELHPEYQSLLRDADAAAECDAGDPQVAENPFLHLGLHVAVREQVAIDRPPGVRDLRQRLEVHYGQPHGAEHALMECLAETLWEAQRAGTAPDESRYLDRARALLRSARA